MTPHPFDALIQQLDRIQSMEPRAAARSLREVLRDSLPAVAPIAHTKQAQDWLRFAAENPRGPDRRAIALAAWARQKLVALRQLLMAAMDVMIVAALDDELRSLRQAFPLSRHDLPFTHETGNVHGHSVVVVRCRMGLVEAAIATTRALCHYRPRLVVMIGVCGGVPNKARIGDVIIANPAFHYQFGAFTEGFLQHELKAIPLSESLMAAAEIYAAEEFHRLRRRFRARRAPRPATPGEFRIAPMACADLVVKDAPKIDDAKRAERKTTGVDMESYAVMQACRAINDVPCIVIKSVQDLMTKKTDRYRRYAADLATSVLLGMLPRLVATT